MVKASKAAQGLCAWVRRLRIISRSSSPLALALAPNPFLPLPLPQGRARTLRMGASLS